MTDIDERLELMQQAQQKIAEREFEYLVCSLCGGVASPFGGPECGEHDNKAHEGNGAWVTMKMTRDKAKRLWV